MSQDKYEIVKMAREAGLWVTGFPTEHIERFATLCRAPLVAEVERLKDKLDSSVHGHNQIFELSKILKAERDTLKAELEQCRKDAERYRLLVSQPNGGFFHPVFAVNNFLSWKSKAQYDAAIDEAIEKDQS